MKEILGFIVEEVVEFLEGVNMVDFSVVEVSVWWMVE